jgi:hypothetical protein
MQSRLSGGSWTAPIQQHKLVARRMIELAQQGERDPIRLREGAIKGI